MTASTYQLRLLAPKGFIWILWVSILMALPIDAQVARWSRLPDLPESLSNNAVTSVERDDGTATIYTFMGITDPTDPETITNHSYRLEYPDGDEWERIADVPMWEGRARIAASAVTVGGEVYLLGGYTVNEDHTETTDPRLLRYEQEEDEWSVLDGPPIEVDDTLALVYSDRYIILVSGWHGPAMDNTRAVQMYDTAESVWSHLGELPETHSGYFGHAGGIVGDTIVLIDGVDTEGGYTISDRVYRGQIVVGEDEIEDHVSWRRIRAHPGTPTYRGAYSPVDARDGRVVIVGGSDNPYNISGTGYNGEESRPNGQVLVFDASRSEWVLCRSEGDFTPTMDHRAIARVGDRWALVGGMTGPGEATQMAWDLALDSESE